MSYFCAHCGKLGATERIGKIRFHFKCVPREPVLHKDGVVKHVGDNKIKSELRTLGALISMVNNPDPHIV